MKLFKKLGLLGALFLALTIVLNPINAKAEEIQVVLTQAIIDSHAGPMYECTDYVINGSNVVIKSGRSVTLHGDVTLGTLTNQGTLNATNGTVTITTRLSNSGGDIQSGNYSFGNGAVFISTSGQVEGGTFTGYSEPATFGGGRIDGGTFGGEINASGATINGGTFNGEVYAGGANITGGTFNGDIKTGSTNIVNATVKGRLYGNSVFITNGTFNTIESGYVEARGNFDYKKMTSVTTLEATGDFTYKGNATIPFVRITSGKTLTLSYGSKLTTPAIAMFKETELVVDGAELNLTELRLACGNEDGTPDDRKLTIYDDSTVNISEIGFYVYSEVDGEYHKMDGADINGDLEEVLSYTTLQFEKLPAPERPLLPEEGGELEADVPYALWSTGSANEKVLTMKGSTEVLAVITETENEIKLEYFSWFALPAKLMEMVQASGKPAVVTYKYKGYKVEANIPAGKAIVTGEKWYGPEYFAYIYKDTGYLKVTGKDGAAADASVIWTK